MSKVLLFSNYVKRINATVTENLDDILAIVKQAVSNGVREIYFDYEEKEFTKFAPETSDGPCDMSQSPCTPD
ncbi:MAG: hypothetical protein WC365_05795 [Candidatus Babeliales bacterium]|jgi:hypothetical protein